MCQNRVSSLNEVSMAEVLTRASYMYPLPFPHCRDSNDLGTCKQ